MAKHYIFAAVFVLRSIKEGIGGTVGPLTNESLELDTSNFVLTEVMKIQTMLGTFHLLTYLLTYLLTPWSRAFLGKLTVSQLLGCIDRPPQLYC
jgi:hypothetical protein